MFRHAASRGLTTLLFTDIVGSSDVAVELGDRRWRSLQARHHDEVRRQLKRFHGHEVDTAGDGFFATFETPAEGLRCAEAIIEGVRELGLDVRAGLHFGEAELTGEKVGGIAVTTAARVSALAGPGQVIVTSTIADLVAGSGLEFSDLGNRELKGVPGQWRLLALSRVDGEEILPPLGTTESSEKRDRAAPADGNGVRHTWHARPRTVVLVSAVAIIALVAATLPFVLHHANGPALASNGIQLMDAASEQRVGSVALPGAPGGIASGGGSVWVSDAQAGTVVKVNPNTRAVVDTIPVGSGPAGIAFGDRAVWVALSGDGELARIDPTTGDVTRVSVGNGPTGVAVSHGSVWVTNYIDDTVMRVETRTTPYKVVSRVGVGVEPLAVAADASGAWVANYGDGTVTRISTGGQPGSPIPVGNGPSGIAIGRTVVWVTSSLDGTLWRLDAGTGVVQQTTAIGDGPTGITVDNVTVWVADHFGGAIARVDATTGAASAPIQMNAAPIAMTLRHGVLWVAASAPPSAHRGGTLRFASLDAPESIDPATAYSEQAWHIIALTNDGLVGVARVGGPQGGAIVPDLALSVPTPSPDGLTYTFQLRPGIHYSNGVSVEPQDFRRGIERELLVRAPKPPVASFYSEIVGAAKCTSVASCDLSRGIVVHGDTITFHLTDRDPEFLYKLALPFADAVPTSTPLKPIGATPLPATGPYMIASYTPGPKGAIELVRNPRFAQWSQAAQPEGYPNRIEGSYGISSANQVSMINHGGLDVMADDSPPADQLRQLNTTYPSQFHDVVLPWTFGFAMNIHQYPFDDPRVRQALNFAVDRNQLVTDAGGPQLNQISCQILPPDFPGYRPYCPYTLNPNRSSGKWSAPDPSTAQQLVNASGTREARIIVWTPDQFPQKSWGGDLVSVLKSLHYQARLNVLSPNRFWGEINDPRASAGVQISFYGWQPDYFSPSGFVAPLFDCTFIRHGSNTSHFCKVPVQAEMRRARAVQASYPAVAGEAWAGIDRSIVNLAPWVTMPTPKQVYFVSSRTGNFQVSPQWGILLGQLWIR